MAVVRAKGSWKKVNVDDNILQNDEFKCFGGLEILENYEILSDVKSPGTKAKRGKKRKSQDPVSDANTSDGDVAEQPCQQAAVSGKAKRRKKSKKCGTLQTVCTSEAASGNDGGLLEHDSQSVADLDDKSLLDAMPAWKDLFVPLPVLRALYDLGFIEPTLIQALVLPSAIRDKKDILGAAETGSGKTLAFGIPLLNSILTMKASESGSHVPVTRDAQTVGISIDYEEGQEDTIVSEEGQEDTIVSDAADSGESETDDRTPSAYREEASSVDEASDAAYSNRGIYALVLTPTRELAVQVRDHINRIAKYTDIKTIAIFGGMSSQKQERLLKRKPEIIVGTPGRLWELYEQNNPHLLTIAHVPIVVVDEADRMVEKGHFEELEKLFAVIRRNGQSRQTLVFSATLTYVHEMPDRVKTKRRKIKVDREHKLAGLVETLGMCKKPKIVDVTRPSQTVQTLLETRLLCRTEEKDMYLYYFLKQHPGRTIIFANSIDSIRRLVSVFTLLQCTPLPLHSEMHQKQRLKNLERFASNACSLLLATDVAARGLDIPNIDHVVHFQVPRTCESYVHRSGRTARASKEGLSLMLIDEKGVSSYRKLMKSLNKGEDLAMFPIDQELLYGYREQVNLARQIDILEHRLSKEKRTGDWLAKAAEEAEILLDETNHSDGEDSHAMDARSKNKLKSMRQSLAAMVRKPVNSDKFCGKYPTQSGKLVVPVSRRQDSNKKSAIVAAKSKMTAKDLQQLD